MANIKCRYGKWKCDCPDLMNEKEKSDYCGTYWYDCINPTDGDECPYFKLQVVEFEGNYKSYEFIDDEGLKTHGRKIEVDSIDYLEIDGRVLIDEEKVGELI